MHTFTCGKYLGENAEQVKLNGLLVTKSCYKGDLNADWHRHENIYLTLILKGGSMEKRNKQEVACVPGTMLLYPRQETHKNLHYRHNSKTLNIEFDYEWFKNFDINTAGLEGQCLVNNPLLKCGLLNAAAELNAMDRQATINLEATVVAAMFVLTNERHVRESPTWVKRLYELLHDEAEADYSLAQLSGKINVHPVTISKYFPKYFKATIGDYIRMIKIERSMPLLSQKSIPMEDIALKSGFADNAHFTRVFKKHTGITPSHYRVCVAG